MHNVKFNKLCYSPSMYHCVLGFTDTFNLCVTRRNCNSRRTLFIVCIYASTQDNKDQGINHPGISLLSTMEFNLELLKTMWCFTKTSVYQDLQDESMTKIISFLNLNKKKTQHFLFQSIVSLTSKSNHRTSHLSSHKYRVAR